MPNDVYLILMADSGRCLDVCESREIAEVFVRLYRSSSPWAETKIERKTLRDQWDADMYGSPGPEAVHADS